MFDLDIPPGNFVLFLAEDVDGALSHAELSRAADHFLRQGAVYVCAWGPRCAKHEDAFDWSALELELDPVIMTTSHADESVQDAFEFAVLVAEPAEQYRNACQSVVGVFVGNVNWYNTIAEYCDDELSGW